MDFASLLTGAGFDLRQVAIMLHQPALAGQRTALLSLVADDPELFERYQDNHPKLPEATLKARKFAASFVVDDKGVTVELGKRDPSLFVFSILELLAPAAPMEDVVLRESSWKERLGTRHWGLNKN